MYVSLLWRSCTSTRPHKGGFVWCYGGFDCMCYRRSRVSGRMTSSMVPFIRRALVPAATFRFKCDERPKCRLTVSSQSRAFRSIALVS